MGFSGIILIMVMDTISCRSRLAGDRGDGVFQEDRVIVHRQQAGSYRD